MKYGDDDLYGRIDICRNPFYGNYQMTINTGRQARHYEFTLDELAELGRIIAEAIQRETK